MSEVTYPGLLAETRRLQAEDLRQRAASTPCPFKKRLLEEESSLAALDAGRAEAARADEPSQAPVAHEGPVFLSDEEHPLNAADVELLRQRGCDVIQTSVSRSGPPAPAPAAE